MYGFKKDDTQSASLVFGLNADVRLTTFEFNPNGGKDGTPQERLDIVFTVNGTDRNYHQFPITRAYDNGNEVTDPNHPKMKEAFDDLNARMCHIIGAFVGLDAIEEAFENDKPTSFAHYCKILADLLPENFTEIPLDVFANYQWAIKGDNNRTFLEFPKKMKHGRFVSRHIPGTWTEDRTATHLRYSLITTDPRYVKIAEQVPHCTCEQIGEVDGKPKYRVKHPFSRGEWFMGSNFANQQSEEAPATTGGGDVTW
jgi:hypothetical protein